MRRYEKYIPLILRIGISFLWVWMGITPKLIFPGPRIMMASKSWVAQYMPFSAGTFIYSLAIIEIILGVLLLIGFFTRIVSAIQIVLVITFVVGLWNLAIAEGITSPLAHLFLKDVPSIAGNMILVITGGGLYSIDNLRRRKI